jgi:hypothetical protein
MAFPIDELIITAAPDCGERRWLQLTTRLPTTRAAKTTWSVADLDSRFVRVLRYYQPKNIVIEFKSPAIDYTSHTTVNSDCLRAILILRAKIFDICEMLGWFKAQQKQSRQIRFIDPARTSSTVARTDPDLLAYKTVPFSLSWGPLSTPKAQRPPKSFWERHWRLGPDIYIIGCTDLQKSVSYRRTTREARRWAYSRQPIFHEILLMPLCLHWAWRNAKISFDHPPQCRVVQRRGLSGTQITTEKACTYCLPPPARDD